MGLINVDGRILPADQPCIQVDDPSYRYGAGLFETMKMQAGVIHHLDLHLDRLFNGISLLKLAVRQSFSHPFIADQILMLSKINNCTDLARIRLSVSAGNGKLDEREVPVHYTIECWPLDKTVNEINADGFVIDIFPDARKSCDAFSNLKNASRLPYFMAATFAGQNKLDDCLLLNAFDRICDSTIANLFWTERGVIYTPPLTEGPVAGVTRKYLVGKLKSTGRPVEEKQCCLPDLENADEVFLTNAITGLRWVKTFRAKSYSNTISREIHSQFF